MKLIYSIFLIFALLSGKLTAQYYFVTKQNDTTYCKKLEYSTNAQGFISELIYEDKYGNKVEIKKRKNIPKIAVIYGNEYTLEPMPLKVGKPNGYYRLGTRVVSGKLKVCKFDSRETKMVFKEASQYTPGGFKNETSGTYLFQITMPDGRLLKLNSRKNMKKIVIPLLKSCTKFTDTYKGNYSNDEKNVIEMIRLYNSLCGSGFK